MPQCAISIFTARINQPGQVYYPSQYFMTYIRSPWLVSPVRSEIWSVYVWISHSWLDSDVKNSNPAMGTYYSPALKYSSTGDFLFRFTTGIQANWTAPEILRVRKDSFFFISGILGQNHSWVGTRSLWKGGPSTRVIFGFIREQRVQHSSYFIMQGATELQN